MKKFLVMAICVMASVCAFAQNDVLYLYNGGFRWDSGDVIEKITNIHAEDALLLKHVKVETTDGVVLYDKDCSPNFSSLGSGDGISISLTVHDVYTNFIGKAWKYYVTYEKDGVAYQKLYVGGFFSTIYDIQPHKFNDGIFINCYDTRVLDDNSNGGTTTNIRRYRIHPSDDHIIRMGNVNLRTKGKRKVIQLGGK